MKYLKATLLGSGALASLLLSSVLTSCQDEDFGYTKEDIRAAAYDRNFIAKYGEIESDMDWDLTRQVVGAYDTRTRALGSSGIDGDIRTLSDWYYVDSKVVETFNDLLPESDKSNKQKGTTGFHLESQGTFYIIPVYQGQSGLSSELHMVVEYEGKKADINLWQRSNNIQRQTKGSFDWKNLRYDWATLLGPESDWTYFDDIDWYKFTSNGAYIASTRAAAGIRTKPIKCEIPVGAKLDFYLKITAGHVNYRKEGGDFDRIANSALATYNSYFTEHSGYNFDLKTGWSEANLAITGDEMWASKGKMIQLNQVDGLEIPDIEKLAGDGAKYMFIACEDARSKGEEAWRDQGATRVETVEYDSDRNYVDGESKEQGAYTKNSNNTAHVVLTPNDWEGDDDMNDLVFLFASAKLPEVKDATTIKKRYIIEDLGSIVDWDFNDIVVDMEQVKTNNGSIQQKATLKHLCGTTPFELFVGETNNESNSVKLDFGGDGLNKVTMGGKDVIDGQVLDQSVELNYEFYLPEAKWNPTTNNIWVKVYPKDRYSNNKHPEGEYEYKGTSGADEYGGSTTGTTNGTVGNGEINATFDYGTFISFAFPRKGKVPRIIAVNPDHEWTAEHHDINPDIWTVYKVTVGKTGNGDVWGEGIYKPNTSIEISAKAEEGYRFVRWNDGNTNAKRTVTVTANTDYTAEFTQLTAEWDMPNSNASLTSYNSQEISGTTLTEALSYGYNTIVLYSNKACDFGLSYNGQTEYIVYDRSKNIGDAVTYHVTQQGDVYKIEIVLTDEQLKTIKTNNKFYVHARGAATTLSKVSLKKTENKFTVNLIPIENWENVGSVKASDRESGNWGSNDSNPFYRNGGNAFSEASYVAGQTVTLTPEAKWRQVDANNWVQDYVFDHWEQYDAVKNGNIINIDKGGANGAITVESSAILKAVFKKKGVLSYTTLTGESLTLQYSFDTGDNKNFTDITSGSTINQSDGTIYLRVKTGSNGFNEDTNHYKIDWQNGSSTKADQAPGTAVTYNWVKNEGLSLNLTVKYLVEVIFETKKLNGNTDNQIVPGSVALRIKGSDEVFTDKIWVPKNTDLELTATSKDGYKFTKWSNNTTKQSRELKTTNGYHNPYAYFAELDLTVFWQDDAGVSVNDNKAFSKFAYGGEGELVEKLKALTDAGSTSVTITFHFKSTISGDIAFYTPYKNAEHEGGWSRFGSHLHQDLTNATSITQTFNSDDIAKIKLFGGLIMQNNTGANFVVTQVNIQ